MLVKQFSSSERYTQHSIFEVESEPEQIRPELEQFVAFDFESFWRVGRVIEIDQESGDVKVVPLIQCPGKNLNRFSA